MKKLVRLLLILTVGFFFFFDKSAVYAAEDANQQVNFVLHKIVFPDGAAPESEILNSGTEDGQLVNLLEDYRGLNGVTFDVYDVSQQYYQLRSQENLSVADAQNQLAQLEPTTITSQKISSGVTATEDGQDGLVEFSLPAKASDGTDKVYLFNESAQPTGVKTTATNLVVVLPVYDEQNQALTTIHLYPKNEETAHITPDLTKTITGKKDYQYGDAIEYTATTSIPADILDYQSYQISDQAGDFLDLDEASLKVTIDGQDVLPQFTLTKNQHGFSLTLASNAALKFLGADVGKELTISYQMILNSNQFVPENLANVVYLKTDHENLQKEVDAVTGGKAFVKVDASDQSIPLANAQFEVLNQQSEYLKQTETGYAWTKDAADTGIVTLTSGADGAFEIAGLAYDNYYLKEVTAPTGYQINNELVPFTVDASSYSEDQAQQTPLKVVNIKNSTTTTKTPDTSGKSPLPQTNELTQKSLIVIGGIFLLAFGFILYRRKSAKNNSHKG
ncbi:SpaH/EbpB family LPXTG-anchored major pilin [Enterococcus sp. HY326]|uniref:SpaH/EbpB family LPXTG-anchored major pilin n=1 Tax=Enterococcus sp. HY326 TaxID=2971265 RepID=UPI0022407FB0|nr:SpaH/EbpB family LPXTG-anchored major pilin [Enterococcus sp. HY326]